MASTHTVLLIKGDGHGDLRLEEYHDAKIPPYIILSHTCAADDEKVTYEDLLEGTGKNKAGYRKIDFCRQHAVNDGLENFWVDTCCIDKSSSTELSNAINSMFRWYQNADECYVFLSDVSTSENAADHQVSEITWEAAFRGSRWFCRGWTVQELIAPSSAEFFSREWQRFSYRITRPRASVAYRRSKYLVPSSLGGTFRPAGMHFRRFLVACSFR